MWVCVGVNCVCACVCVCVCVRACASVCAPVCVPVYVGHYVVCEILMYEVGRRIKSEWWYWDPQFKIFF